MLCSTFKMKTQQFEMKKHLFSYITQMKFLLDFLKLRNINNPSLRVNILIPGLNASAVKHFSKHEIISNKN